MDFSKALKGELYAKSLQKGDVFISEFDKIDHEKFFVIAGLSEDKIFACSVFINSQINPFIMKRQYLLDLQVLVKKVDYAFLHHDSYIDCSSPKQFNIDKFKDLVKNKKCRHIAKINESDLTIVTVNLKKSGLLTEEEIELYF